MIRQSVLIFIFTSAVCLVCLKQSSYFKTLYKEWRLPHKWSRVQIVDEKSAFDKFREFYFEYLDVLVVGVTACIVSLMIGWTANAIRKGYADFTDGDMLIECLEEHRVLNRRMKELEGKVEELERSSLREFSENVPSSFGEGNCFCRPTEDEFKLAKCDTVDQACQSYYNESSAMSSPACLRPDVKPSIVHVTDSPCKTNERTGTKLTNSTRTETEKSISKSTICKSDIEATGSSYEKDSIVFKDTLESTLEIDHCTLSGEVEREHLHDDSHEVSDKWSSNDSKVEIFQGSLEEGGLDDGKTHIGEGNHGDGSMHETVENIKNNVPNQVQSANSCWYTESENYLKENDSYQLEADGNISTIGNDDVQANLSCSKSFSTKTDEAQMGDMKSFELDVSPSTMTVTNVGARSDSARSGWSSSNKMNSTRGRIPQRSYRPKENKTDPKTGTFYEKDNKTMRSTTGSQQSTTELSMDGSGTRNDVSTNQHRPNTASGDTLHTTGGQRKKKHKYYGHNSSFKTDSTRS